MAETTNCYYFHYYPPLYRESRSHGLSSYCHYKFKFPFYDFLSTDKLTDYL